MGIYITISDVRGKAIDEPLTRANWTDTDIEKSINEAESYIESRIIRLGYQRNQLQNCQLIKTLMINYSRYCILRDIYTQISPSRSAGEEYEKWKNEANRQLELIENNTVRLVDNNGELIIPLRGDMRYKIKSTTENVKRAITLDENYTWKLDPTYWDEEVVGKKVDA